MKRVIATIFVLVLVYLAGSFISLELNPTEWSEKGRFNFVWISICTGLITFFFPLWSEGR